MGRTSRCAVAALTALLLGLTAACGGSSSNAKAEGGPAKLIESLPAGTKAVDQVNWALPFGEPLSLDPARAFGESEQTVVANVCESLLRTGPDYSVNPGVATSADWKDPKTFVVDLRDDVTFWDGSPLTADDVAFSMTRNLDPNISAYGDVYSRVASIDKTGPLQVTLTFKAHDAQFKNAMAAFGGAVISKKFAQKAGKNFGTPSGGLMCTGPYSFVKWAAGDSITVKGNSTYWDGAPKVKTLNFKFITDSATLTSALLSGEVDGSFNVPVGSVDAFKQSDRGNFYTGPSSIFMGFFPVTETGPAANPRVREALDLSIDKKAFVRNVLRGYGEPLKTLTPPIVYEGLPSKKELDKAYADLPSNAQDVTKAKSLVSEAKADGKPLTFVFKAGDAMTLQAANLVQSSAGKIGFKVTLKPLQPTDFDAFFFDPGLRKGVDFVLSPAWIEVPGLLYYAPSYVRPKGFFNYSGYDNPEVTKLLDQSQEATDDAESAKYFAEAQAIFAPDRPMVTLGTQYVRTFLRKDLTGITTSSAFFGSPWAAKLGGK